MTDKKLNETLQKINSPNQKNQQLKTKIDSLEKRIKDLEQKLPNIDALESKAGEFAKIINELNQKLTDTNSRISAIKKPGINTDTPKEAAALTPLETEKNYFKGNTHKLADFLNEHGYSIITLKEGIDRQYYKLAKQIYSNWPQSWNIINTFKTHKNNEKFSYDISSLSQDIQNKLSILCLSMHENNNMLDFEWDKEKNIFNITWLLNSEQKHYLNGECYEHANRYLIDKTINEFNKTHSVKLSKKFFQNIKLRKNSSAQNINDMELDFIAQINDRFFIFETKAGMNVRIDKWVDRARLFELNAPDKGNRYITCCLQDSLNPYTFMPFHLFLFSNIEKDFTKMLEEDFPDSLPIENMTEKSSD